MSRREAVRISLGVDGQLQGASGAVRCIVVDMSVGGALLAVTERLPEPPLTLRFEAAGEELEVEVIVHRVPEIGNVAVTFEGIGVDRMHRLITAEQRLALAEGRRNIVERRVRRVAPGSLRGEVL